MAGEWPGHFGQSGRTWTYATLEAFRLHFDHNQEFGAGGWPMSLRPWPISGQSTTLYSQCLVGNDVNIKSGRLDTGKEMLSRNMVLPKCRLF